MSDGVTEFTLWSLATQLQKVREQWKARFPEGSSSEFEDEDEDFDEEDFDSLELDYYEEIERLAAELAEAVLVFHEPTEDEEEDQ